MSEIEESVRRIELSMQCLVQYPESYFEGEERDGFYIEPMMKKAWAAQIEVLLEVQKVCEKNGIQYFAEYGTMLGAVRHKGFIPWDDDLDICMRREDYMKFISVVERDLPKDFVVLNIHTEPTFTDLLTRVVNGKSIQLDEKHLEKYHGCPYVVGIDVFPVDYLPRNTEEADAQLKLLGIVLHTAQVYGLEDAELTELGEMTNQIAQLCGVKWKDKKPMQYQLYCLAERLCAMYGKDDADNMGMPVKILCGKKYIYSKQAYDSAVMMPFETIQIPVPVGYDEILKAKYGEYMIPYIRKKGHAYPFYKEQREILRQYLKANGMSGEGFYITEEERTEEC